MALYAIGDLHLSLGVEKPMDIFGGAWTDYMKKLEIGMSILRDEDTVVLMGDLSWALGLEEAKNDFAWINNLPGRKIILKGNHDYWWCTAKKFHEFCESNGFTNIHLLHNNHFDYGDMAICGTRGWFFEEEKSGTHDEKVFKRELLRLEESLKSAEGKQKIVFLHYPPRYKGYICEEIISILHKYDVRQCYYGHLHGASHGLAQEGIWDGIEYKLLSADRLGFCPACIIK